MEYYVVLELQTVLEDGFDYIQREDVGCVYVHDNKEFAEDQMLNLQQRRKGSRLFLFKAISRTNPTHIKNIFRIDAL